MSLHKMEQLNLSEIIKWYHKHKEQKLYGRRIIFDMIEPILKNLPKSFVLKRLGESYHKVPIYKVCLGTGTIKILIWSQMHGNESTGTKAIFDILQFFKNPEVHKDLSESILEKCTLVFIPMLNPDGALAYTRKNAQGIDLNRDALALKAPESKLLFDVLKQFDPHFCFNLHDQRTIFSVGQDNLPATISFLAPSVDKDRTITSGRKVTMSVISKMAAVLQKIIPNQIGRYTDEFYPKATGDNFEKAGHHTILIEAGHYQDDYDREEVRKFNFIALLSGFQSIKNNNFEHYKSYFNIPNNKKFYLDIIYKNVYLSDIGRKVTIGVVFKEKLVHNTVDFKPEITYIDNLYDFNANTYIDKDGKVFKDKEEFEKVIEN